MSLILSCRPNIIKFSVIPIIDHRKNNNYYLLLCSLSDLPECQVPLAKRADVIVQMLAMALHPAYICKIATMSVEMIFGLTQSPETHIYCIRREIMEKMLEVCQQRRKMVIQQSSQSQQGMKEDLMKVNVLKYVIVPSPLYFHSIYLLSCPLTHSGTHAHTHKLLWPCT
jgi:hypothetical protein